MPRPEMQASGDGAIEVWSEVLSHCDASRLIEGHLGACEGETPLLLALGKAGAPLLQGAARVLPAAALDGALVVQGAEARLPPGVELRIGDHPLPAEASLAAGRRVAAWAEQARGGDRPVWVLLSGGASSLLELPREGVGIEALLEVHARLHAAGVPIEVQNAVRARLSGLKGGGLSARLGERLARLIVLVDIPGGAPEWVGSGPCSPELPWPGGLEHELERRGLLAGLPAEALHCLARPPPPAPLGPVKPELLATPETLVEVAARRFREAGVPVHPLSGARAELDGADLCNELCAHLRGGQGVLLVAGEATFDRRGREGPGRGGRAAHLALSVLDRLDGVEGPWVFLAGASDGRDGEGEGGAVVTHRHPASAGERREALRSFSSADFHRRFASALPGHEARTNLCDLYLAWC